MDGLRAKDNQRKNLDDQMLIEIEKEMERKAIANSMMEVSNKNPHQEEEVKQIVEDQQQQDVKMWEKSSIAESVIIEHEIVYEEEK